MIFDRIVLASQSPRRAELLRDKCRELLIIPQNVDEVTSATDPKNIVKNLSQLKLGDLPREHYEDLVIASDTIVWYNGKVYGKPKDSEDAVRMLKELANNTHKVYTGFSVAYRGMVVTDYDECDILFKDLTEDEIVDYVESGSPLDKAGAYGVQDGVVVKEWTGDIDTIIGLPVKKVIKVCEELVENG